MAGAVPEQEEHGGLDEALEAGADVPAAGADPAAAAGAAGKLARPFMRRESSYSVKHI